MLPDPRQFLPLETALNLHPTGIADMHKLVARFDVVALFFHIIDDATGDRRHDATTLQIYCRTFQFGLSQFQTGSFRLLQLKHGVPLVLLRLQRVARCQFLAYRDVHLTVRC